MGSRAEEKQEKKTKRNPDRYDGILMINISNYIQRTFFFLWGY